MRCLSCLLVVWLCAACVRPEPTPSGQRAAGEDQAHWLVVLELSPTGLRLVQVTEVPEALPTTRVQEATDWHLALREGGVLLWEADIPVGNQLRGEFAGEDGKIEGFHLLQPTATFATRVPKRPGTLSLLVDHRSLPGDDARAKAGAKRLEVGSVVLTAERSP
jgi:hypothetical protein